MKTRVLTGIVGIVVILLAIFISRYAILLGVLFLIGAMVHELMSMREEGSPKMPRLAIARVLSVLCAASFVSSYIAGFSAWVEAGLILNFLVLILSGVLFYPKLPLEFLPNILFDGLYIGFPLTYLVVIRDMPSGALLLLFVFILIWSSDSCAYFTGVSLKKKHPLAPKLSPKKSKEGAIGGIIGALVFGLIFNAIFHLFSWLTVLWFAPLIAVIGIFGDLFESMIKRYYGFKDSGNILPGHGGFLDRFDSLIAVLPVAGLLMSIV